MAIPDQRIFCRLLANDYDHLILELIIKQFSLAPRIAIQVYNLKVGSSLVKTYSGLTGTTFTYTANQAFIDNGSAAFIERRLEIFSVRDGLNSVERHVIPLDWTVNA